jgi:hypothetical protein
MDHMTLSGSIAWQPSGAPADVVNFADSIGYATVVSIEVTADTPSIAIPLDGGTLGSGEFTTFVYMEVYNGEVTVAGYSGSGSPPSGGTLVVSGAPAGSFGSGRPTIDLIGRFMYATPADDSDNFPPTTLRTLYAFPGTGSVAKVWAFIR